MIRVFAQGGKWFDISKATIYHEKTWWNGNNQISVNTMTNHSFQNLYRTPKGAWILCKFSSYQNVEDQYLIVDDDTAKEWLLKNEYYEVLEELDQNFLNENEI